MSRRRAILFIIVSLSIVAGSYVMANRLSTARSIQPVANGIDDAAPAYGQMTTDQLIVFWRDRTERDPRDYLSMTLLAQTFLRKGRETGDVGDYERADAALRQALAINPGYTEALATLSTTRYVMHDFTGALELAERVYATDPRQAQALATVGDARLELGDYSGAATTYRQLAEKVPGPAVGSRLARVAWLQGEPDEALRLMRQAVADATALGLAGESAAWYHLQLGELYFNTGRFDEAANEYTASSKRFEHYYLALAGMGKVRAAQGHRDEAIDFYERAVAIVPQPDILAALGDLYTLAGRPDDAQRHYDTVEFIGQLAAINKVVYNRQLALFWANHDQQVDRALALASTEYAVRKDVYGADALAWTLYKNGRYQEAAATMEQALARGTRDALLAYHAGMIYERLGDRERAKRLLADALAMNPHFDPLQVPIARATLERLRSQG